MRAITLFRGIAWFGVVVVFWSLNMVWGSNPDTGAGPPAGWHRTVVGAGLLSLIAAMALTVAGRGGNPPGWIARGVAAACAALVLLIAWRLRVQATGPFADAILGQGWSWLLGGGGLVASAVLGTMGLRSEATRAERTRRKRR